MNRALVATVILLGTFGGCADNPWDFQATGAQSLILPGFAYDGRNVQNATGSLKVRLAEAPARGEIVARIEGAVHTFDLQWHNFTPRSGYAGSGLARGVAAFGDSGNGPGILPEVYAYVLAVGEVVLAEDGRARLDPTSLDSTFPAVFAVTRGEFRNPESYRVLKSDRATPFSSRTPQDGFVSEIGAQAALYVFVDRGDLYRAFEFHDVRITQGAV